MYIFRCVLLLTVAGVLSAATVEERTTQNLHRFPTSNEYAAGTIVAIHGCSGISLDPPSTDTGRPGDTGDVLFRRHYLEQVQLFNDAGFDVFIIDMLSAENLVNACGGRISSDVVAGYISMSVRQARSELGADAPIHLVSWSMGAQGAAIWLAGLERGDHPVLSATLIYGCDEGARWRTDLPVLLLLGADDDIARPEECAALIDALPGYSNVTVRTYENARHGFDIKDAPPVIELGGGYTLGGNGEAREKAWAEMMRFISAYGAEQTGTK
jgi:dienelactone hydrolase